MMLTTSTIKLLAVATMGLGATAAMAAGHGGEGRERPTFEAFDTDGSGEITAEDLAARQSERFAILDTNGDGSISEAEYIAQAQSTAAERATARFAQLDADGDGMLSQDVLAARSNDRHHLRLLNRLDADNSGGVSAEEFEAGIERMAERRKGGNRMKHRN